MLHPGRDTLIRDIIPGYPGTGNVINYRLILQKNIYLYFWLVLFIVAFDVLTVALACNIDTYLW